ncbi:winged helix-turn-helix domain-containing protein [Martelella endophytica]|uniref:winged helix-turn-helix domain-containing protein n=1 Tax=Martelella endophytica TaxID=1486262 RepID=UPI0006971105|nr:helix-turn-helix domain-containing protein [Martelella endophytica]
MRYLDIEFSTDFLTADRDGDGVSLAFTRQERTLLQHFTANSGRLLNRSDLLSVLGEQSENISDRHVDFLINQLRRKLQDTPRAPRFIRTQYGEGYVWVAPRSPQSAENPDAFLIIGPVRGLRRGGVEAQNYIVQLTEGLHAGLGPDRKVIVDETSRLGTQHFTIEVVFHRHDGILHAALLLRHAGQFIGMKRIDHRAGSNDVGTEDIIQAIWSHLALPPPSGGLPDDLPPWIRQHDAALILSGNPDKVSWRDNARMLEKAMDESPHDQRLRVMWALNLYARLLQSMSEPDQWLSQHEWQAIEREIEETSLSVLAGLQWMPEMGLAVAKLLLFVNNDHTVLAEGLVDQALRHGSAFATAAALRGEIAAIEGEIDAACQLYDEALELSEPGTEFFIYLMLLKASALRAGNRLDELQALAEQLRKTAPLAHARLALLLSPSLGASQTSRNLVGAELTSSVAAQMLQLLYNVFGRRFKNAEHRRNIMNAPIAAFSIAFGDDVVSEKIRCGISDPA